MKWNVEYHQEKLKEEYSQLAALEAAVHHHKTLVMNQSEIVAPTFRWSNEATGIVGSDILQCRDGLSDSEARCVRGMMRMNVAQVLRILEMNREEHEWRDEDGNVRIVVFNFLCKTWETPSYRDGPPTDSSCCR